MIEVVLDFKDIESQEELVLYMRKKLGLPYKNYSGGWDSFEDSFGDLFLALPPKDYIYKDNDDWGFKDYNDYIECLRIYGDIGPKDSEGEKGDFRLIINNFKILMKKLSWYDIDIFLKIILSKVSEHNIDSNIFVDWYNMEICIKS